jgi:hypothetical protein
MNYFPAGSQEESPEVSQASARRRDTVSTATLKGPVPFVGADKPHRKNIFVIVLEAMMEARMRQAQAEIRRHRHLLPSELEEAGLHRINARNEEALPFGGW